MLLKRPDRAQSLFGRDRTAHHPAGSHLLGKRAQLLRIVTVGDQAEKLVKPVLHRHRSQGVLHPGNLLRIQAERVRRKLFFHAPSCSFRTAPLLRIQRRSVTNSAIALSLFR